MEPGSVMYTWRCSRCYTTYQPDEVRYVCPMCGDIGILDMIPDYDRIRNYLSQDAVYIDKVASMWRYRYLMPLILQRFQHIEPGIPSLSAGWTPLYQPQRLREWLQVPHLFIKDDGRNPTGSLKDRASASVVAKALELNESVVATASSGNAAAALAGMSAAVGLKCVLFVPHDAPPAKLVQLSIYGATVLLIEGGYDQAFDVCLEACKIWGWYCRNTAFNPHTTEGKKTVAFEIIEQLRWRRPDTVIVSVGDGNIITALHRGFEDALALGWIEKLPRLIGVQSSSAPALYEAWRGGTREIKPSRAETRSDSINVSLPRDGWRALRAVQQSGGLFMAVDDTAILQAVGIVAQMTGIFTEPAGAAAFAGLFALVEQDLIHSDECVVIVNTGHGLKDLQAAEDIIAPPSVIAPTLRAIETALAETRQFGLGQKE